MGTTSFEHDLQDLHRFAMPEAERQVCGTCPKYGSVRLSVCETCPSWGGYIDTGNLGAPARRYRVYCLETMPRHFRAVGGDFFIACPLARFRLQAASKCGTCDLSHGWKRFPRNLWQKITGRGEARQMCAHPIARSFQEIA